MKISAKLFFFFFFFFSVVLKALRRCITEILFSRLSFRIFLVLPRVHKIRTQLIRVSSLFIQFYIRVFTLKQLSIINSNNGHIVFALFANTTSLSKDSLFISMAHPMTIFNNFISFYFLSFF